MGPLEIVSDQAGGRHRPHDGCLLGPVRKAPVLGAAWNGGEAETVGFDPSRVAR